MYIFFLRRALLGLLLVVTASCTAEQQPIEPQLREIQASETTNEQSLTGNYQLPRYDKLWGLWRVEWKYYGDVIVTPVQGRFCYGFKCAHGRGKLWTDGSWGYTGTFRYGDIVGKGSMWDDYGEYSGLFSSSSFPGGPTPLCGGPSREGVFPVTFAGFRIQFHEDKASCAGRSCKKLECLKAWARRVDRGEAVPLEEARRNRRWYEKIRAAQLAILDGHSRRTFDKIVLSGTDIRYFLVGGGWRPISDARIHIVRYVRLSAKSEILQLILGGFETPYSMTDKADVSEVLPMEMWRGRSVAVVDDPWTVVGLAIRIRPTGYLVTLPDLAR